MANWNLLANPIFVKSLRTRLRLKHFFAWGTVTTITATFLFLMFYKNAVIRGVPEEYAYRGAFLAVFVFQCFLLMFFGTGSVASGIASEKDLGTIYFQRLTPMSPISKIVGYLFGLPIREYVLFALTLPFSVYATSQGAIPMDKVLLLYLVLFSTVTMYHLFGLVSGMLSGKTRKAGWIAMVLVCGLYIFRPALNNLGFTFFGYLTIIPTLYSSLLQDLFYFATPLQKAKYLQSLQSPSEVFFYDFIVFPPYYTLVLQAILCFTCFLIVYRKWKQEQYPIFSKSYSILFFFGAQVLLLGSLWPFLTRDVLFQKFLVRLRLVARPEVYGVVVLLVFFLISFLIFFFLVTSLTPSPHDYLRGLRGIWKQGKEKLSFWSDAHPFAGIGGIYLLFTLISGSVLFYLMHLNEHLLRSGVRKYTIVMLLLVVVTQFLSVIALRSLFTKKTFFFALFLLWVLPAFLGVLLMSAWKADILGSYTLALTPPGSFLYGILNLHFDELKMIERERLQFLKHIPTLVSFSIITQVLISSICFVLAKKRRTELVHQEKKRVRT